ncbi:hypothetical protein BJ875DRAFT_468024 [Amylocarpus encephaloides]|uniref:Uncharacterized protein n=1 Tax=Amylocarpus encephaloides TaxID=45428 RepID=A0A9P8C2Y5_9HELO|nr:hypothetical protein BJ875DRAFT_468024 [Amylocarpus encephaloides]
MLRSHSMFPILLLAPPFFISLHLTIGGLKLFFTSNTKHETLNKQLPSACPMVGRRNQSLGGLSSATVIYVLHGSWSCTSILYHFASFCETMVPEEPIERMDAIIPPHVKNH